MKLITGLYAMQVVYVFIVVTFISIPKSSTFNVTESDLTPEWIIDAGNSSRFPPAITSINDELLHLFFPTSNPAGLVQLESSRSNCQFQLTSPNFDMNRVIGATAMKNDTVSLVMLERSDKETEYVVKVYTVKDHYRCSEPIIDALVLQRNSTGGGRETLFGYENTFDLILKNSELCGDGHLCKVSYDVYGDHVINVSGTSEFKSRSRDWGIDVVDKNSSSSGFFYMELDEDHKYLVLKLDSDLKIVGRRRWNRIVSYSAIQGRVTLCDKIDKAHLNCSLLDSNLNDLATAIIPMDENVQTVGPWEIFNTPGGGAIFFYAIRINDRTLQYSKEMVYTYIRIISSDGKVGEPIKFFDHNVCERYRINVVEMDHGLCFRLSCLKENLFSIKCIVKNKDQFLKGDYKCVRSFAGCYT